jgi:hypothetical protein
MNINKIFSNLIAIPIILWCGCLALAQTNAMILKHKPKWDFIDKITFFQSPVVMYYYFRKSQNEVRNR